jgi:hypothetical protein
MGSGILLRSPLSMGLVDELKLQICAGGIDCRPHDNE